MNQEMLQDWLFRYQYIFKSRNTMAGKRRFLDAIAAEAAASSLPAALDLFPVSGKETGINLYLGDLEHAKKVLCTYYDTPKGYLGSYTLFDRSRQQTQTLLFLALSGLLVMAICTALMYVLLKRSASLPVIMLCVVLALLCVWVLRSLMNGSVSTRGQSRNTASIAAILASMAKAQGQEEIAYAFLDYGCCSDRGLEQLKQKVDAGRITYLDCIQKEEPRRLRREKVVYITSAREEEGLLRVPQKRLEKDEQLLQAIEQALILAGV